jgi:amino acid transporter
MISSETVKRKLTLTGLVAATYFMVAGGPYGLEELVQKTGYQTALLLLVLTPLLWSLPTALMVGELASAIPDEGGYYVWVERAMGPFWGFQEAWLSLCASVFDMAIYPTLFLLYLGRLWPAASQGSVGLVMGVAILVVCAALNLRGSRAVGGASELMAVLLLGPFVVMAMLAFTGTAAPSTVHAAVRGDDLLGGTLIAMWNFGGWDNASTVAGEVDRPQRTYPLAILITVCLVALTYLVPVAAAAHRGLDPSGWTTGSWVTVGGIMGGRGLALAMGVGGMLCGLGMANALVMSYSRLPLVLALNGRLPRVFARQLPSTGAPWVSILALTVAWSVAVGLGLQRLIELYILLYGLSLMLEFAALAILRMREPALPRPFRIPGGLPVAMLLGAGPAALLLLAFARERHEYAGQLGALTLALALAGAGPLVYALAARARSRATGLRKP